MQSGWLNRYLKATQSEQSATPDHRAPDTASTAPEARGVSRRAFIQGGLAAGAAVGLGAANLFALHSTAHAQHTQRRVGVSPATQGQVEPFWPSPWGEWDQAGASNWITPAKVLQASQLIQTGQIYEMSRVYESDMPFYGTRSFTLTIPSPAGPGMPTGGPFPGANGLIFQDEWVTSEIGQVGTQFDGLGHIGMAMGDPGDPSQMYYYNGWTQADIGDPNGLRALGIENVKPIFTRGYLIDVAGYYGVMLPESYEISLADVLGALAWQGISQKRFAAGDAFFFHTGWGSLWKVDNTRFNGTPPGIGLEVAHWLIANNAVVAGADTWPLEVVPNPDPNLAFPVHQELIMKNGIYIHENLDLSSLAAAGVYEFVYVMTPLRMRGGTGSPGRPIAII